MTKADCYKILLERFTSDKHDLFISKPFFSAGKNISTDGTILVATPPVMSDLQDCTKYIEGVYPLKTSTFIGKTYIDELKSCLDNFPKMKKNIEQVTKCDACEGRGEVHFYFEHDGVVYEEESCCPVCEGTGFITEKVKTSEMIYNPYMSISVEGFTISANMLDNLKLIAEILAEEQIYLYIDTNHRTLLAKIGEVDVLIAKCNTNQVHSTLKLIPQS